VPAAGLPPDADLGPWLAALNEKVEGLIARAPQDYLWAYNRFKVPAGRAPAHA
jgi:KDO2-lipid IV(A) lauroyltransferase